MIACFETICADFRVTLVVVKILSGFHRFYLFAVTSFLYARLSISCQSTSLIYSAIKS